MRASLLAAVAGLALVLLPASLAEAQDPPPAGKAPEAAVASPAAPIPYADLVARPAPRPRPAAPAATPTPAAPPPPSRAGARLTPAQPIPAAELEAYVDGMVRDAMARDHIAGATVSVVQDGQVTLKKGYGFARLSPARPVDPDRTLFRIGSISKTFTWIALMKAVEAGRIQLDQPVNRYLPQAVQVKDHGDDPPVRVINLMDHSPGFEDRMLGHLFEDDVARVRPLELYLRQERPKQVRPPGAVSSYSNYGVALAGEAAAYTARKPFEQLVEEEILIPARLGHTSFREPHAAIPGLPAPMSPALAAETADGYRWTAGGFQRQPYEFIEQIGPAGAASSSGADMARYMQLLLGDGTLEGTTIFGPRTAQAFRTPIRATPAGMNGWAHGFMVEALPGGFKGYGHDGETLSFFSNLLVIPELRLGVFVATNSQGGGRLSALLPSAIVREFYARPDPVPRPGVPELVRRAEAYRGVYVTTRRPYSGLEGFVMRAARASATVAVAPDGRLLLSGPGGARAFTPDGALEGGRFIGVQDESRLFFDLRDGRAVSFTPGFNGARFERAPAWKTPRTLGLFAILTALAALATLVGLAARNRRDLRQNPVQARASLVQNIQAGLWLTAMALFAAFAAKAADPAWVMYRWPGPLIILASACALVAAALTLITLASLPAVWSGGRRLESWTYPRKAAFTITVLVYLGFSLLLGAWGALAPWSG